MSTNRAGATSRIDEDSAAAAGVRCGVYVHVPFCRRRCPYCDFYFEVAPEHARFGDVVVEELRARRGELPARAATLSFGGGTPSRLSPETVQKVVDAARAHAGLEPDAEVSLEANPEDVDEPLARGLARAGIGRVTLGVQSFDDDTLKWLGRAHDGARARAAIAALQDAGIERIGVDLILGVPGERAGRLARDLDEAHAARVGHLSAYLLTVEEGTPLVQLIRRGQRADVDDDRQADAYEALQREAPSRGWRQYEISNFARPGEESRHNRLYWAKGSYLGVGPGAHSLRLLEDGAALRTASSAPLPRWLDAPLEGLVEERLAPAAAFAEAVAFGLRDLLAGVDVDALAARHRCAPWPALQEALTRAEARGLLARDGARLRLTSTGARFADGVARDVLASHDERT